MDGVAELRLVQRRSGLDPLETIPPAVEPIRPGRQHLSASRRRALPSVEPVEDLDPARRVPAKGRAHFADDRNLPVVTDLVLAARRRVRIAPLHHHGASSSPRVREAAPDNALALEMSARCVKA